MFKIYRWWEELTNIGEYMFSLDLEWGKSMCGSHSNVRDWNEYCIPENPEKRRSHQVLCVTPVPNYKMLAFVPTCLYIQDKALNLSVSSPVSLSAASYLRCCIPWSSANFRSLLCSALYKANPPFAIALPATSLRRTHLALPLTPMSSVVPPNSPWVTVSQKHRTPICFYLQPIFFSSAPLAAP